MKLSRIILGMAAILLLSLVTYAAEDYMIKTDRSISPKPDQALIVFMRSSFVGSAISSSLFDITTEENKFIGVFKSGIKVCYDIAPGEYTFMVLGEGADFLKAKVAAGKTYYVLITPRMGAWKARFSMKPLRQSDLAGSDFSKWDAATKPIEKTAAGEEWAKKNAESIAKKRAVYWPEWLELSQQMKDSMTLNIEDGR